MKNVDYRFVEQDESFQMYIYTVGLQDLNNHYSNTMFQRNEPIGQPNRSRKRMY